MDIGYYITFRESSFLSAVESNLSRLKPSTEINEFLTHNRTTCFDEGHFESTTASLTTGSGALLLLLFVCSVYSFVSNQKCSHGNFGLLSPERRNPLRQSQATHIFVCEFLTSVEFL